MAYTVCIIDDDMVSQFATRYCLGQYPEKFEVLTCNSAEDGIRLCASLLEEQKKLPDYIFLDLSMGDMNGWAFIENLKLISEGYTQPKIFILSAFVNAKDRLVAKEHPMVSGYFDKPLTATNLEEVFEKKLSK